MAKGGFHGRRPYEYVPQYIIRQTEQEIKDHEEHLFDEVCGDLEDRGVSKGMQDALVKLDISAREQFGKSIFPDFYGETAAEKKRAELLREEEMLGRYE